MPSLELNKTYTVQEYFSLKEAETGENKYVQFEPELIIEVLSESTMAKDLVDKFIQYRKTSALNYYLLVEPEKYLVLCNFKDGRGEWNMVSYTKPDEIIDLPKLNISMAMEDIYKK